ncbi:MAG TPA: hypothetical protein VGI96_29615 [Streptosporangiaceae bacterium]
MGDIAHPLRRLAGADLGLLPEAPHPRLPGRHQQVLGDTRAVAGRAMAVPGFQPQPVDLHGLPAAAAHVEQPGLDAGGGDQHAGPVRDQGRQRHAECAGEGVERAQRRVAGPVLDFRERPLANVCRLGQRAEGQPAFLPRCPQSLAYQPGQIVHDEQY